MAKLRDFLQKTFEQGDVRGDEIAAVLGASALAEIELPDAAVAKFNEAYLTRSRAENDPEIVKKIKLSSKAEILDTVDKEIAKLYPLLDSVKAAEIEKNQNTFKKIELLTEALDSTVKNSKANKDKDVQKVEEEWAGKYKNDLEKNNSLWKEKLDNEIKKNKENELNYLLKNKLLTFEYSDAFSDNEMKDTLVETIMSRIKASEVKGQKVTLEVDGGKVNVRHIDQDGTLRDIYANGNEKLTIDNLIVPAVEKFIKKSNGKANETDTSGKKTNDTVVLDPGKATLRDIQWATAK